MAGLSGRHFGDENAAVEVEHQCPAVIGEELVPYTERWGKVAADRAARDADEGATLPAGQNKIQPAALAGFKLYASTPQRPRSPNVATASPAGETSASST